MYCTRKVSDDVIWVGADNRRATPFEGLYSIPNGVSYNSYLILDEKTALMDTVDKSVESIFYENVKSALGERELDYLVIQHMEPDHSAAVSGILLRYPSCRVVTNKKVADMLRAFTGADVDYIEVKEGDTIELGRHKLTFVMAPMVHWPEVMVIYDSLDGTLYSADAFGTFGALSGALFADEVDFERDYLDEARRYYTNIVGKYGSRVMALLKKASTLDIKILCPLHGFVWRENIDYYVNKYVQWATYSPEKRGVNVVYASIYGNTEIVANALCARLRECGIETRMHDVSVDEESWIIADSFKYSHLCFASPAYNSGLFPRMESLLHEIVNHGLSGRRIGFIESGSWAPSTSKKMREILSSLNDTVFLDEVVTVRSSLHDLEALTPLINAIKAEI